MASNQFADLLKRERQRHGWKQKEVARKLGTTRVTVARWETGKAYPTLHLRSRLSKLLGRSVEDFIPADAPGSSSLRAEAKLEAARQKLLADEEARRLEAEKHSLEMQIRLLEMQRNHIESTIELTNRFIDMLDPTCDAETRSLTIEQLLSELPHPSGAGEQALVLPTIQIVRTILEVVKQERTQAQEAQETPPLPPEEVQQNGTPVPSDAISIPGAETGDERLLPTSSISASANEDGAAANATYGDTSPGLHPNNPYDRLTPILDPHEFVGRASLMLRLYKILASRQSISLVGPHRMGKSSVLHYLVTPEAQQKFATDNRLQAYLFVLKDLGELVYDKNSPEGFFDTLSAELLSRSGERSLTLAIPEEVGAARFSKLLDQISDQGFYPVLLLDEFDKIVRSREFDPDFFAFLRTLAGAGKVSYVIASEAPLYEISRGSVGGSPFFNIFYTCHLEALTEEDALNLISLPAKRAGLAFTPEEIAWVRKEAGLHPFFIRRVCYVLFEEKLQRRDGAIDMQYVRRQAYRELSPHFQDIWNRLSETQRSLLQDEAQQKGNKQRALPELSESAFFRMFVRKTCEVGLAQMSVEELEEALNAMNDFAQLGETNLRLMRTVASRLDGDDQPTSVEKGKVIREVLNEAFERLRGSGTRSDSAPDWVHYNILFYRYFRHHLKNSIIAARLEFYSDRQYYRARTKAIEALRNVLLEME